MNKSVRIHKGPAKHWLAERVKSIVLFPLTIALLWIVVPLMGQEFGVVEGALSQPLKALLMMGFFAVTAVHLSDGIQVVLEDYVHNPKVFRTLSLLNKLFSWGIGLIAIYALAKLAFF